MIESIIQGITDAIYSEFGDDYDIYTEAVEQGLEEPCFFVSCINPSDKVLLGRRRIVSNQFAINYISKGPNDKAECNSVFERLNSAIEFISVDGDSMMAKDVDSHIEDGILTVTVTYECFTYSKESGDVMESHSIKQEVK